MISASPAAWPNAGAALAPYAQHSPTTILNLMGLEDERLTYLYAGRNRRLTDIGGKTLEEIIS